MSYCSTSILCILFCLQRKVLMYSSVSTALSFAYHTRIIHNFCTMPPTVKVSGPELLLGKLHALFSLCRQEQLSLVKKLYMTITNNICRTYFYSCGCTPQVYCNTSKLMMSVTLDLCLVIISRYVIKWLHSCMQQILILRK